MEQAISDTYGFFVPALVLVVVYGVACFIGGVVAMYSWTWLHALFFMPDDTTPNRPKPEPPPAKILEALQCLYENGHHKFGRLSELYNGLEHQQNMFAAELAVAVTECDDKDVHTPIFINDLNARTGKQNPQPPPIQKG
jgi:hypothetical protein